MHMIEMSRLIFYEKKKKIKKNKEKNIIYYKFCLAQNHFSQHMTKPTVIPMWPGKTQINL